jgi:hypothetical protein
MKLICPSYRIPLHPGNNTLETTPLSKVLKIEDIHCQMRQITFSLSRTTSAKHVHQHFSADVHIAAHIS